MIFNAEHRALFVHLFRREFTVRYAGSVTGPLWLLLTPLALLAIYGYVFVVIFKAKIPEADMTGFLPYLAVALWPWMAFADGLSRAVTAITDNESLISKTAIPRELLVYSAVSSTFVLQLVGYVAVLITLAVMQVPLDWGGALWVLWGLVLAFCLALGLGLILATLEVFIKDISHGLPAIITLWFFATPILYSTSLIPERWHWLLQLNPMAYVVNRIRSGLLHMPWEWSVADIVMPITIAAVLVFGHWLFMRCSSRFEDFL